MNLSKGMRHVSEMYTVQAFALLKAVDGHSISYFLAKDYNDSCAECTPPWEDAEGYGRQGVWYDPVTDAEGNPEKYWMAAGTTYDNVTKTHTRSHYLLDNSTGDVADLLVGHVEDAKSFYFLKMAIPEEGSWSPTFVKQGGSMRWYTEHKCAV